MADWQEINDGQWVQEFPGGRVELSKEGDSWSWRSTGDDELATWEASDYDSREVAETDIEQFVKEHYGYPAP
ncbi:hypothetical protein [Nocardia brasiliensis]|uniref:hypothetical protein n=1 Tax=Nocardia brasiliensis TaxID=37326 RepID=UPI002453F4BC|nr:hypothetical protein [Nocardia brasiliensis]